MNLENAIQHVIDLVEKNIVKRYERINTFR